MDVERLVQLRDQVLDIGDFFQLLRAEGLQLGSDDAIAVAVDLQLELLQLYNLIFTVLKMLPIPRLLPPFSSLTFIKLFYLSFTLLFSGFLSLHVSPFFLKIYHFSIPPFLIPTFPGQNIALIIIFPLIFAFSIAYFP